MAAIPRNTYYPQRSDRYAHKLSGLPHGWAPLYFTPLADLVEHLQNTALGIKTAGITPAELFFQTFNTMRDRAAPFP